MAIVPCSCYPDALNCVGLSRVTRISGRRSYRPPIVSLAPCQCQLQCQSFWHTVTSSQVKSSQVAFYFSVTIAHRYRNTKTHIKRYAYKQWQESCAIAKMTAQCTIYMGALKIFGTPRLRPRLLFPIVFTGFCSDRPSEWMFLQNLKSVALSVPQIIGGSPKIWTVSGYVLAPFSPKFLIGFYSDWPYKYTCQICTP